MLVVQVLADDDDDEEVAEVRSREEITAASERSRSKTFIE
jgi:hypothetical protein